MDTYNQTQRHIFYLNTETQRLRDIKVLNQVAGLKKLCVSEPLC